MNILLHCLMKVYDGGVGIMFIKEYSILNIPYSVFIIQTIFKIKKPLISERLF